jgi:hypothetical protein
MPRANVFDATRGMSQRVAAKPIRLTHALTSTDLNTCWSWTCMST